MNIHTAPLLPIVGHNHNAPMLLVLGPREDHSDYCPHCDTNWQCGAYLFAPTARARAGYLDGPTYRCTVCAGPVDEAEETGPGRYEGSGPSVAYVDALEFPDDVAGDMDHAGYIALYLLTEAESRQYRALGGSIGARAAILYTDTVGFVSVVDEYTDAPTARDAFATMAPEYWAPEYGDDYHAATDAPLGPVPWSASPWFDAVHYCGPTVALPSWAGPVLATYATNRPDGAPCRVVVVVDRTTGPHAMPPGHGATAATVLTYDSRARGFGAGTFDPTAPPAHVWHTATVADAMAHAAEIAARPID